MSNPYFDKNPVFNGAAARTPNGYPTMPGYRPGAQAGPAGTATYPSAAPQQTWQDPRTQDMGGYESAYAAPAADAVDTGRLTYNDVVLHSGLVLGTVVVAAAVNWVLLGANPVLTLGGAIVGFVLALVQSFKREPSPLLIMAYAVAEGFFLGGISAMFGAMYEGIVAQAVLGTFITAGVSLFLFSSGRVRVTAKFTKVLMVGMISYLLFSLANLVLVWTGLSQDPWGLRTGVEIFGIPLGVLVGGVAIVLAAMSLIMDFDSITRAVDVGAPKRYAWLAAFGLTVTLIWLYTEILRVLAILRQD